MESFSSVASPGFCFRPEPEAMTKAESGATAVTAAGALDICIHHARNIHNICIYAKQDVYAKFSLTCSPDDAVSTRTVHGGGKNPQFDQRLQLKLAHPTAATVLKCEIWMLSGALDYLEDQLLGFALVPLSAVGEAAAGRLTGEFSLSSTDLFHSPAGTVQLTLSFDDLSFVESDSTNSSSISLEFVILDPARIEFPEIDIAEENQKMVSEYFSNAAAFPFIHLGDSPLSIEDCEMAANFGDSPVGISIQNSGRFSSSTTTSIGDDRQAHYSGISPDTPTSESGKGSKVSADEVADDSGKERNMVSSDREFGSVFKSPLGNINMEAEQSAMQQHIADMYMRSMQQFTESLAKMKLPMDLGSTIQENGGDVIQNKKGNKKLESNKNDGSRVFYGSRAFF